MVRIINIDAADTLTDTECDNFKGTYLGNDSYDTLIDEDCDYICEGKIVFKFRKNKFKEDLLKTAWDNCSKMAKASRGRGAAAGPIDPESVYWKKRDISWMKKNYGKEYEGVIRSTFIISPEGLVAAKWHKVKVRVKRKSGEVKHADVVREKLLDLQG